MEVGKEIATSAMLFREQLIDRFVHMPNFMSGKGRTHTHDLHRWSSKRPKEILKVGGHSWDEQIKIMLRV